MDFVQDSILEIKCSSKETLLLKINLSVKWNLSTLCYEIYEFFPKSLKSVAPNYLMKSLYICYKTLEKGFIQMDKQTDD